LKYALTSSSSTEASAIDDFTPLEAEMPWDLMEALLCATGALEGVGF